MSKPINLFDTISSEKKTNDSFGKKKIAQFTNDLDLSIKLLTQSFITWHRLKKQNIVREMTLQDVKRRENWQHIYPNAFIMLHKGSTCKESIIVGMGKYCKVYKRGEYAYKYIKLPFTVKNNNFTVLKCNLKELCYFHSMNHPNVMRPIRSQMVMEHGRIRRIIHEMKLAKCTLSTMILSNEITSFDDISSIMLGVARGLAYMHQHKIVHGDVKPSNILIMSDYTPIVSDFTLTTFQNKGAEIAFGTLFWRAPECLVQQDCSEMSDVWSFGMMLLDALYGCIYFRDVLHAKDNADMLSQLVHVVGQPPLEWVSKYIPENTDILFQNHTNVEAQMKATSIRVLGTNRDKANLVDLLGQILKWQPEERITMQQVLEHSFFTETNVNQSILTSRKTADSSKEAQLSDMIAATMRSETFHQDWNIQWRNEFEKKHLEESVGSWHRNSFQLFDVEHMKNYSPMKDWLLNDIVIKCKRVIERLRYIGVTFDTVSIVKWCASTMCFIWEDRWNPDEQFESAIYHFIHIINFVGFPLTVTESKLGDSSAKKNNKSKMNFKFLF